MKQPTKFVKMSAPNGYGKHWLVAALCALTGHHAGAQGSALSIIEGSVHKDYVKTAILYSVSEGTMVELATQQLDAKGSFAFAVPNAREGLYYVGDEIKSRAVPIRIYLKTGDHVQMSIDDKGYSETTTSEEGTLLNDWQQLAAPITEPAYKFWTDRTGYVTYFPELVSFLPKAQAFKGKINTRNAGFNQFMRFLVDNDVESAALHFLETPRVVHPSAEERPDFYKQIVQPTKYCTAEVLQLGDGVSRVFNYSQFTHWGDTSRTGRDYLKEQIGSICNDTLKGALVIWNARSAGRSLEKVQIAMAPYKQYLVTDSLKAKYDRILSNMASFAKGEKAYSFKFPDVNGKDVSLDDFKGKVLYIDMWATWCGPCKKELPSLKALEEAYKENTHIAFLSISIDESKDTQKWLDFVKTEQLGGTQIHAPGWENEFAKYYKITGIPRFLLIDEKGNLISADAPRPSEDSIKGILDKALSNVKS